MTRTQAETHRIASDIAAHIVNTLLPPTDGPRAALFGKILFLILRGMEEAQSARETRRNRPSVN